MCLGFSGGTEISTADLETAAAETQRERGGSCVLRSHLATPCVAADPEQRPAPC